MGISRSPGEDGPEIEHIVFPFFFFLCSILGGHGKDLSLCLLLNSLQDDSGPADLALSREELHLFCFGQFLLEELDCFVDVDVLYSFE